MPSGHYKRKPAETRFWERVNKEGPIHPVCGQCWLWTAGKWPLGYGAICINYKMTLAHRYSWELAHGRVEEGAQVLHRCDTPTCVNPAHLFVGTQTDNMRDCSSKGRLNPGKPDNKGERNGQAELTEEDVTLAKRMKLAKRSVRYIARYFNLSVGHTRRILKGQAWKHHTEKASGK